jgi:hypothetical protein
MGDPKFVPCDLNVFCIPAGMLVNALARDQEDSNQKKEGCVFHGVNESGGKVSVHLKFLAMPDKFDSFRPSKRIKRIVGDLAKAFWKLTNSISHKNYLIRKTISIFKPLRLDL